MWIAWLFAPFQGASSYHRLYRWSFIRHSLFVIHWSLLHETSASGGATRKGSAVPAYSTCPCPCPCPCPSGLFGAPTCENQDGREFSPEENRAGARARARARGRKDVVDCMALRPLSGGFLMPPALPVESHSWFPGFLIQHGHWVLGICSLVIATVCPPSAAAT